MKRAEVWRMWPGSWGVRVFPYDDAPDRNQPVRKRPPTNGKKLRPVNGITFPTHQAAMRAALAEVGLAKPAEHREAP